MINTTEVGFHDENGETRKLGASEWIFSCIDLLSCIIFHVQFAMVTKWLNGIQKNKNKKDIS